MWEPRPLTPLWAFKACYRDSFTFAYFYEHEHTDRKQNAKRSSGKVWSLGDRKNVRMSKYWTLSMPLRLYDIKEITKHEFIPTRKRANKIYESSPQNIR
jgi:hypothetical protein